LLRFNEVHPRLILATLPFVAGVTACAAIAGLGDYEHAGQDGGAHGATADAHGTVDVPNATDLPDSSDPSEDATSGEGDETGATLESGSEGSEASAPPADAAVDAAAACQAQCGGCCDSNAMCHGGLSVGTCGANGAACMDCSSSGKVCSSAGKCVAATVDSGTPPPSCTATSCTNKCALLEGPCCKQDGTCGCAVLGLLLCN
jgi:hypothetical protein